MLKLVYAVDRLSYNNKDHLGVVKKVEAQISLFQKKGIAATLCQYVWEDGYPQIEIEEDTDILYFRRIEPSVKMILKLCELKRKSPKLRLIMEIPTYPFGEEEREKISIKRKINRLIGEKLLRFYIDRIVLIAQQNKIEALYGVPVICVNNGIDFSSIAVRSVSENKEGIHVLCVSGCFFWHGYERFIEGLNDYYKRQNREENVYFHIVGDGECLNDYKVLADKYGLLDKVVYLHGRMIGQELDEMFDLCDIALDCLGAHRKGLYMSSSLKTREYAAKGLPMAASISLDIQNEKTDKYILMFPADESAINIEEVVDFYHRIYDEGEKTVIAEQIRNCFYPYCDWEFVFDGVVDYIVLD